MSIITFTGDYKFLSNFYPVFIEWMGIEYGSTEAAYQAQKFPGKEINFKFLSPSSSKYLARRYERQGKKRDDWEAVSLEIMYALNVQKFRDNEELKEKLLDTDNKELVEVNWWGDTFWGESPLGNGQNNLGKILMRIREELRSCEY